MASTLARQNFRLARMDQMKDIIIALNQRIQCESCFLTGLTTFTSEIPKGEAIMIECKSCGERMLLHSRPYPKMPVPLGGDSTSFAMVTQEAEKSTAEGARLKATPDEPKKQIAEALTFGEQTNIIANILYDGTKHIETLMKSLGDLNRAVAVEFGEAFGLADSVNSWDIGFVKEFIEKPFLVFPVETDDPEIRPYCAYIAAPKFFKQRYGVPLPCSGGFFFELALPYTRFSNCAVPEWLLKFINLAPSLELEVVGDKIIGPSLGNCWADIPGVVNDDDHTESHPSIKIHKQREARTWLARHGVPPWGDTPFARGDYSTLGLEDKIAARVLSAVTKHGRVGLLWWDNLYAMGIALQIASKIHGGKLFISGSDDLALIWEATRGYGPKHQRDGSFMWAKYQDIRDSSVLSQTSCVFVNYGDGSIPLEFMESLYKYAGPLVVLTGNPVLDALAMNDEAEIIFGLVAHNVYVRPEDWGHGWKRSVLPEGNAIKMVLDNLQGKGATSDKEEH